MRCFLSLSGNIAAGLVAGYAIAGTVGVVFGLPPLATECTGAIGGCLAGIAGCL
jgi:hypothetical protein